VNAQQKSASMMLWVFAVAGIVIGGIVTVFGLVSLEYSGPVALVVGLFLLAAGVASMFTYLSGRQRRQL
jgi:uncharacterized membrane protein HdeD (DUF308 family)